MSKIPPPKPGVYPGVPFEEYLRWDAVSQSQLKELARSPAHLRAYLTEPDEDTDALRIGRALHCAVLEPEEFTGPKRFGILPDGTDRRTKEGKAIWAKIVESGATPIKQAEHEATCAMRDALHKHTAAGYLLRCEGATELSIVWVDERTGVTCKARQDKHASAVGGGVILDVKTCTDASPREFARSIFHFGYHRQGAFYLRGAEALGIAVQHYAILAVEKSRPHACAVYRLTEGALDAGDAEVDALLALFNRCQQSDEWPGYTEAVQDIAIPDWAWAVSDELTKAIKAGAGES